MAAVSSSMPDCSSDKSRQALDFAHRLLSARVHLGVALPELLAELSTVYAAVGAGLADGTTGALLAHKSPNGRRTNWPATPASESLSLVRSARTAVTLHLDEGLSFLATPMRCSSGAGWILWLEVNGNRAWTDAEAAALALVAEALLQWLLGEQGTRGKAQLERQFRQQRLERNAPLVRRLAHDFGNILT